MSEINTTITSDRPGVYLAMPVPPQVRTAIEQTCTVAAWPGAGRPDAADLRRELPGLRGLLVSNQVRLDNQLLADLPELRVVSINGVGYDNIDIPFATAHGVLVCNTPVVLNAAVADLTLGFLIALARGILPAHQHVVSGAWTLGAPFPLQIDPQGKTLGLLGLGRIAQEVARRAVVFGLHCVYFDPVRNWPAEAAGVAHYVDRETLFRQADFLSVHTLLDEGSRHAVGAFELSLMKPSAFLINTARGPVVDQAALAAALATGTIAGAALDVLEREPPLADDPILSAPNVLLAPHIGSGTHETRRAMVELAGRNLIAGTTGGQPEAMVNPSAREHW